MMPYRFKRRAFLSGVGGAFGLKILLQNLEAQAMGATSPPRFLMMHWPVGIVRARFMPTGSGTSYTTSPILEPFETAGLREDMIVLTGLSHNGIDSGNGGGHESGTPMTTTGANCPGTRDNNGEDDDGCAGGPSWDQILLKNVPDLQRPGAGYVNAICDARIDSYETSTQCLSYSYTMRSIASARPGGMISEATPLLPTLSPVQLYMNLFNGFMPGDPGSNNETVLRALYARKSVLDYAMSELAELERLAPGSERSKIQLHTDAIRAIELQISDNLMKPIGSSMGCMLPAAPDPDLIGKTGSKFDYTNPEVTNANEGDQDLHEAIGNVHANIIMAAFQCDIIRVATFQWSPGTNHVSFKGLYPAEPDAIYMHHPLTHKIANTQVWNGDIATTEPNKSIMEFTCNAHRWYNEKTAAILSRMKAATDSFGNSLLAHTVVPYVTEVAEPNHSRSPIAACIFGGSALGMQGGQYQNLNNASHNNMWLSVAQAYFQTDDPLAAIRANETPTFVTQNVAPINGLWEPPA